MQCPKCGNNNVNVVAVTETKSKTRWGCGCLVHWIAFLLPKYKSKTHTEAICQSCGYRWTVSNSVVRKNAKQLRAINAYADAQTQANADVNAIENQGAMPALNGVANIAGSFIDKLHSAEEPFYKRKWFLITNGIIFPPLGIALVWLVYKDWDTKKKAIVSGIMALWLVIAFLSGGNETDAVVSKSDVTNMATATDVGGIATASNGDIVATHSDVYQIQQDEQAP